MWTRVVSEQVRTALGGLSAPQREALTLAYYGGYTQREVAALTGAPLGTVKTRMLSGMRRLKQELGGAVAEMTGGALGAATAPEAGPMTADRHRDTRPSTSSPSAGRCTPSSPRTRRSSSRTWPAASAAR